MAGIYIYPVGGFAHSDFYVTPPLPFSVTETFLGSPQAEFFFVVEMMRLRMPGVGGYHYPANLKNNFLQV